MVQRGPDTIITTSRGSDAWIYGRVTQFGVGAFWADIERKGDPGESPVETAEHRAITARGDFFARKIGIENLTAFVV